MSAQDPQKMHYPQTYPVRAPDCACGHAETVHFISEKTKERTDCSVWFGGRCRCKQYEAVADE